MTTTTTLMLLFPRKSQITLFPELLVNFISYDFRQIFYVDFYGTLTLCGEGPL